MYALINSYIYTGTNILDNHALIISKGIIKDICPIMYLPKNIIKYDLNKGILSPGFIDLQLNGCGGVQFSENTDNISVATLEKMQRCNQRFGCTSFLPTLITSNNKLIKQAINVMRVFLNKHKNQALGLHLEGPFLNPYKKGIHNASLMYVPTKKIISYLCDNNDVITKITLAPEILDLSMIKNLYRAGIFVSIGHSIATYNQTKESFDAGVSFSTHLFNAMSPLTSREPGIIGAVFDTPNIYCSIIADGIHVHWCNIRTAKNIKKDHLILVTDGTSVSGSVNMNKFLFSGKEISCRNGVCTDKDGTISGSSITMIEAIQNTVKNTDIPLDEVLRMVTLYPARYLGIDHKLGSLEKNKIANLAVFNERYQISKTIVNGIIK